jgi:hypothetical protein
MINGLRILCPWNSNEKRTTRAPVGGAFVETQVQFMRNNRPEVNVMPRPQSPGMRTNLSGSEDSKKLCRLALPLLMVLWSATPFYGAKMLAGGEEAHLLLECKKRALLSPSLSSAGAEERGKTRGSCSNGEEETCQIATKPGAGCPWPSAS